MTTSAKVENAGGGSPATTQPKKVWLKQPKCWILLLFILTILLAACIGIIWQYQKKINNKIALQLRNIDRYHKLLEREVDHLQHQSVAYNDRLKELNVKVTRLAAPQQWQHAEQVLHEVEFLLQQASLQLKFLHSPKNALELLILSKQQLEGLANPDLLALIIAIRHDISQLQHAHNVDIDSLYARLSDVGQVIDKLSFIPTLTTVEPIQAAQKVKNQQNPVWYQQTWQGFKQQIAKYIIISHSGEESRLPLLSEQARALIRLQMQSLIEMAKWALLQKNVNIYQQALWQLSRNLIVYYPQQEQLNKIQAKIAELRTENIAPLLPDIENSKQAVAAGIAHIEALLNKSNLQLKSLTQPLSEPGSNKPSGSSNELFQKNPPENSSNQFPRDTNKSKIPKTMGVEI